MHDLLFRECTYEILRIELNCLDDLEIFLLHQNVGYQVSFATECSAMFKFITFWLLVNFLFFFFLFFFPLLHFIIHRVYNLINSIYSLIPSTI